MSPTSGTIKTVVELDLVSYSDIARVLEENLDVFAVKAFQDQIQSFVNEGLGILGLHRDEVVFGTAGDNALLFFDDAATAHKFSETVQQASADYNRRKSVESAKRWFRIGAATGALMVLESERRIVGTTVSQAVRLEAAAKRGQLVIDRRTFESLPDEFKSCYGPEEIVHGKREERIVARRCSFIDGLDDIAPSLLGDPPRNHDVSRERSLPNSHPVIEPKFQLRLTSGPAAGAFFPIGHDRITVGRSKDCDIVLSDPFISRAACALEWDRSQQAFILIPFGTMLAVNDTIVYGQLTLSEGDRIALGRTLMMLERAKPSAAT